MPARLLLNWASDHIVDPPPTGHVDPRDIAAAIRPNTALVSVMHANNETGAIQPVDRIAAITRDAGVALHVDAVHTAGKIDIAGIGAQMVSISGAARFEAPAVLRALSVVKGCWLTPLSVAAGEWSASWHGRCGSDRARRVRAEGSHGVHTKPPQGHAERGRLLDGLRTIGGVEVDATDPVVRAGRSVRRSAPTLADALDMQASVVHMGPCSARKDAVSNADGRADRR